MTTEGTIVSTLALAWVCRTIPASPLKQASDFKLGHYLRFGRLDLDLLHEAVAADMAASPLPVSHRLAVTCLDQVGERVEFWHGDTARTAAPAAMLDTAQALLGGGLIASFGPTRDTLGVGGRLGRRQRHAA